jgi:hypothetical protein
MVLDDRDNPFIVEVRIMIPAFVELVARISIAIIAVTIDLVGRKVNNVSDEPGKSFDLHRFLFVSKRRL